MKCLRSVSSCAEMPSHVECRTQNRQPCGNQSLWRQQEGPSEVVEMSVPE